MSAQTGNIKVPCPLCSGKEGKDVFHNPRINGAGTAKGNSEDLGNNIMRYRYKTPGKPRQDHSLSKPIIGPNPPYKTAQAHHLIPSQLMANNDVWTEICKNYGYNINYYQNGIFLPNDMRIACQERIPCHKSNHQSTDPNVGGSAYVAGVKDKIESVANMVKKKKYCLIEDKVIDELNDISKETCELIMLFTYQLHIDGIDFISGGPGCSGRTYLSEDKKTCTRNHNLVIGPYLKTP